MQLLEEVNGGEIERRPEYLLSRHLSGCREKGVEKKWRDVRVGRN
jgi:hypothetical protein